MVELVVRLVFSLAVVLGMLLLLTRLSAKRFRGGSDALVRVLHRQPLSRTSAVAVLTVGSRVLVVGTTEHQVQLLTELDPDELDLPRAPLEELGYAEPYGSADFDDPAELNGLAEAAGSASPLDAADPAELAELAELSEFSTLDELLGPAVEQTSTPLELVEPSYAPRHAVPARTRSGARMSSAPRTADGALAGSLLSAQTWKQAFAAATGKARDAS